MAKLFSRSLLVLVLVGAAGVVASNTSGGQEREDHNSGSYLYRAFCAPCHGSDGKGKGPVADMLTGPVPDLTLLTRHADGVFPRDRVFAALDGIKPLPGHTRSAMPQWSTVFDMLEGHDQHAVQKRLTALVDHVQSLQVKDRE